VKKTTNISIYAWQILSLLGGGIGLVLCPSCSDQIEIQESAPETEKYQGEMILFSAGTTVNSVETRADNTGSGSNYTTTPGKTYYMPNGYRFVCRMYYQPTSTGGYDVVSGSDVITWLKVDGNVGNSLYWRNSFVDVSDKDTYGNDAEATCLYWQNRNKHAFLAWTNLNEATTIGYNPVPYSGTLKFEPADIVYKKHTGRKEAQWFENGYELSLGGNDTQTFASWSELKQYLEGGGLYNIPSGVNLSDFDGKEYYYAYGWSCKYCDALATTIINRDNQNLREKGWIQYKMYYDKLSYEGSRTGDNIEIRKDEQDVPAYLYNTATNKYLAEIEIKYYKTNAEGKPTSESYQPTSATINSSTNESFDEKTVQDGDKLKEGENVVAQCKYVYNLTDEYGNPKYNEEHPRFTFYYRLLEVQREQEVIEEYKANAYDLTRGEKNSISEQPDICQALTIQEPLGATQAANRVNLYFKHQFSQVQVNLKTSADASVTITKENILKVELLGVTEEGYVFTEIKKDGTQETLVEPASYKAVDVSKYTDEQLADNQYGTSFSMFDMGYGQADYEYPSGYLKSYNALTFGQLQAIRVTWKEHDTNIEHKSTYHVADETLKNLKSGHKYVWNIELRRGTLAIVRTEIVQWEVPADGSLDYSTHGTISN